MQKLISFLTLAGITERLTEDMSACLQGGIAKRGRASLAVSGGRTPEHIFPTLACRPLAWDRITITLADDRWVDGDHPDSNAGLTRRLLLKGPASAAHFVGLKTAHEHPDDGLAETEAALARMDWPLDVIYLGMGEDGHIASLFPGTGDWMAAPGRAVAVAATAGRQARMSLTSAALLDSWHIFMVISGAAKKATYEAALKPGPVGEYPVRLILHQDRVPVTVYVAP